MGADNISAAVDKVTAGVAFSGIALKKRLVIPVRNKTNILRIPLFRVDKTLLLRNRTYLVLGKSSKREVNVRKLLLSQRVEKIALILGAVLRLIQQVSACFFMIYAPFS